MSLNDFMEQDLHTTSGTIYFLTEGKTHFHLKQFLPETVTLSVCYIQQNLCNNKYICSLALNLLLRPHHHHSIDTLKINLYFSVFLRHSCKLSPGDPPKYNKRIISKLHALPFFLPFFLPACLSATNSHAPTGYQDWVG